MCSLCPAGLRGTGLKPELSPHCGASGDTGSQRETFPPRRATLSSFTQVTMEARQVVSSAEAGFV